MGPRTRSSVIILPWQLLAARGGGVGGSGSSNTGRHKAIHFRPVSSVGNAQVDGDDGDDIHDGLAMRTPCINRIESNRFIPSIIR
jgi:hypothetical protein